MRGKVMIERRAGIGIGGLWCVACLVVVLLKATGRIGWSWWLVLLPYWGPIALIAVLVVIGGIVQRTAR
jgi:hypothetical protein